MSKPCSFGRSLLVLLPLLITTAIFSRWKHYQLPEPVNDTWNNVTNLPQVSERAILEHARVLSEDIGYRTVGTLEHANGDKWMLNKAHELQRLCQTVLNSEPERHLECEVWHQIGSGTHRFDILGKRLYKNYVNLTNIVVRISDGTENGKAHALLVNAHVDSTLPSPGAADDALAVGAILEAARTLVQTPNWTPTHALVLLFNNAEESLQDGSHLFSTAHVVRGTVRAVLNVEAAGTRGLSLVFQATSPAMVEAYSHVPRPYGTIVANDVFSSGIIMSDTDFRQFEAYLGVPGLDIAVVGHSYFYHTRKDIVEYIEPGVAQHMGDTALALMKYMTAEGSSLVEQHRDSERQKLVYFSFLNTYFIQYRFDTAMALYALLFAASVTLVAMTPSSSSSSAASAAASVVSVKEQITEVDRDVVSQTASIVKQSSGPSLARAVVLLHSYVFGAFLGSNAVAVIMRYGLDRPLSWFKNEFHCLFLYGPPALVGALYMTRSESIFSKYPTASVERKLLHAQLLVFSAYACLLQALGVGSAVIFAISGIGLFVGVLLDVVRGTSERGKGGVRHVPLATYAVGQVLPQIFGAVVFYTTVDIFVPLTGRMGAEAPAEFIIATITAFCASYALPLLVPFITRYGIEFVRRAMYFALITTIASIFFFANVDPFDAMHPKRVFVVYNENITTNAVSLGVGTSDRAPGFSGLVHELATFVGKEALSMKEQSSDSDSGSDATAVTLNTKPVKVDMHEYNGDWDVLYPFSAFLSPYDINLEPYVSEFALGNDTSKAFRLWTENDVVDPVAGTRSFRLVIHHPGLIWTTIAFDAQVLSWSLDDDPPKEHARHFVKEASFYGIDTWSFDMTINIKPHQPTESKPPKDTTTAPTHPYPLRVNFVGVQETAMWPGKAHEKARGGRAMAMLEKVDGWLEERTGGRVDATLLGCVGGVVDV